jgi:hypothetical protein
VSTAFIVYSVNEGARLTDNTVHVSVSKDTFVIHDGQHLSTLQ